MSRSNLLAPDEATFYRKAALLLLESVTAAVEAGRGASIALSGGSTPRKLFSLLAEPYFRDRIPWQKVYVFWTDERCVPPDHAESNYKLAHDLLLSKVPIPAGNIHRMRGEMESAQEAARAYQQEMQVYFRLERSFPEFDFMLMGMGDDGHTASLFPGTTAALREHEKWVVGHFVEKVNGNRLTLTYPVINNAARILFLVEGDAKAAAVKEVFTDEGGTRFPAQRVEARRGELIWLLDPRAVSKLPPAVRHKLTHL